MNPKLTNLVGVTLARLDVDAPTLPGVLSAMGCAHVSLSQAGCYWIYIYILYIPGAGWSSLLIIGSWNEHV